MANKESHTLVNLAVSYFQNQLLDNQVNKKNIQESDVSLGKTEIKAFVKFISPAKGYFRETYKSQNINLISATPKFTLDIIQIKVKSLSTSSIKNKLICTITIDPI